MAAIQHEMSLRITRNFKDTVFRDLFGSEERKEYTLSLYNALNGTNHKDPNELELTTIENVIYLGMKHDVSFLISDELVLWEHQSTHNPNMPLRGLLYFSTLYSQWVQKGEYNIYGKSLVRLPHPQYVVFKVGADDRPEREIMRLSDAYPPQEGESIAEPCIEVTAIVLNIDEGKNKKLAEGCAALAGYAHLLALVRETRKNVSSISEAVEIAIQRCIDDGYLVDYLRKRRAEVKELLLTEFDQEVHDRNTREEGREEERANTIGNIVKAMKVWGLAPEKVAEVFELSADELDEVRNAVGPGAESAAGDSVTDLLTTFDQEAHDRNIRDEGREEERANTIGAVIEAVKGRELTLESAARLFALSAEELDAVRIAAGDVAQG